MRTIMVVYGAVTIHMVVTDATSIDVQDALGEVANGKYESLAEALIFNGFKVGASAVSDEVINW